MEFKISGDFIKFDSLLKACNIVSSGGEAKILIQNGEFSVNGETETRRGRKLYKGDTVSGCGEEITVM